MDWFGMYRKHKWFGYCDLVATDAKWKLDLPGIGSLEVGYPDKVWLIWFVVGG